VAVKTSLINVVILTIIIAFSNEIPTSPHLGTLGTLAIALFIFTNYLRRRCAA